MAKPSNICLDSRIFQMLFSHSLMHPPSTSRTWCCVVGGPSRRLDLATASDWDHPAPGAWLRKLQHGLRLISHMLGPCVQRPHLPAGVIRVSPLSGLHAGYQVPHRPHNGKTKNGQDSLQPQTIPHMGRLQMLVEVGSVLGGVLYILDVSAMV